MEIAQGSIIGNYRILRPLGKGGMGTVYEVEHVKLGVRYALKAFDVREGEAELFRTRFAAEGKILARLVHPNVVHVFDLDFDERTGTPYYVMDLVASEDGQTKTLASVEPGSVDEDTLAGWFADMCAALDYVHSQGVVHRDVKLGNILVAPDGHAVLSDFGISRVTDEKLRAAVDLEVTAATAVSGRLVMGTAGYIAPEVAAGGEATPAADVYSLGVVFFKLLTGVWYDRSLVTHGRTDLNLLRHFENRWQEILPQMLDEDPAKRPLDLEKLAARLTASPAASRRPWAWVAGIAAALGVATGAYLLLSPPGGRAARPAQTTVQAEDVAWLDQAFAVPGDVR